jgi:hypothetical protein
MENGLTGGRMADDALTLDQYRKMFADARDLLQPNRLEQQIDDDYYHGTQLTSDELRTLNDRKQPTGIFNRYRKSINGTLGVIENGATDPRAYGRNPGVDEDAADVVTKTLRYAADLNDFDDLRLGCAYDYLTPGHCAVLVEVDDDKRPKLTHIRWEEFFYDPRSRHRDFSDARYMGIAKWMYADDVSALYPKAKSDIDGAFTDALGSTVGFADETFQDRPKDGLSNWIDIKNRRMMVVEMYHRDGGSWNRCVFFAGGILEAAKSPYLDDKKRPDNAIVAMSCYVDRNNNRTGIGRDLRAPQDEFNKRRQKLLHQLNNRQLQASDPNSYMPIDADTARQEAARPDGIIPPGWQPVSQNDLASGQFQLLSLAETELDRQGPNPAILARGATSASGRSKQVDQQAGLTEDAMVYKGLHNWEVRVYRAIWDRCRQFWTAPDYIRVTDDAGAPQYIGINQPQMGQQVVMDPATGQATIKQVVIGYDNALAELDVDIILDTVPDMAVLAQEQFQTLSELAQMYGPQEVPFDDLLELSQIPDKRRIIEKRKARADQMAQAQAQQQQVAMAGVQTDLAHKQADTMKTQAQGAEAAAKAEKIATETAFTKQQLAYWGAVAPMPAPQPLPTPPPNVIGPNGMPAAGA